MGLSYGFSRSQFKRLLNALSTLGLSSAGRELREMAEAMTAPAVVQLLDFRGWRLENGPLGQVRLCPRAVEWVRQHTLQV